MLRVINGNKTLNTRIKKIPIRELEDVSFLLHRGLIEPTTTNDKKSKLDGLKNPEIFMPQCRGGFASSSIIFARKRQPRKLRNP